MAETVDAIYEDGVLRPIQPLHGIDEHSRVRVTVEPARAPAHPLAGCIGILPDEDADDMRRGIENEFEQVNPRERQ
jgi:predicted DNA-binding antitoxin AbrB/MazE fold protein